MIKKRRAKVALNISQGTKRGKRLHSCSIVLRSVLHVFRNHTVNVATTSCHCRSNRCRWILQLAILTVAAFLNLISRIICEQESERNNTQQQKNETEKVYTLKYEEGEKTCCCYKCSGLRN
ncbi:hypothetical protein TNCV_4034081 [Trichonephila clavipes]|nr:hypothetical protein TNCV_4034081 [Trichonephila clavipes]